MKYIYTPSTKHLSDRPTRSEVAKEWAEIVAGGIMVFLFSMAIIILGLL